MPLSPKNARLLNKLFNIRTEEWPRVFLMFLMATLGNTGYVWGTTIIYAGFLKQMGLGVLPWILVLSAILSILAVAAYTAFVDRIANDRLLMVLYVVNAVNITLGLVLLWLNLPSIAYPLLYIIFVSWLAVRNPHFLTYVNGFYDTQAAKRVLPVVQAGSRAGAILAGVTMPFLITRVPSNIIIALWLLSVMMIIGLIWFMSYFLKEREAQSKLSPHPMPAATAGSGKQRLSYLDNMKEGFRYTTQSTYLRWMAIGTLLLMVLMALIEYRSSELLLEIYGTQEELASFLAQLVAVGNIIVFPLLLFGVSRFLARRGIGNANLIFPGGNLVICGSLILVPGWFSASAAYFNRNAFRIALHSPIDNLLYNAVPLHVKGRARAFVTGLLSPTGQLIGGLLLLVVVSMPLTWLMTLIGILAVVYFANAFIIRKLYSQALIKMLEQENYSFLLSQEASDLNIVDPATLKSLQKRLETSDDPQFTIFMAKLISQIGGTHSAKILVDAAQTAQDPGTRAGIVDVMTVADMWGESVQQLYTDLLSDPGGKVRQAALAGLEHLTGLENEQFLALALQMLDDPDIEVKTQLLFSLAGSENFYALPPAVETLNQILAQEDPQKRARGVAVLGQVVYIRTSRSMSGVTRPVYKLTTYLFDSSDQVRLQAALAVENVSKNKVTDQLAELIIQQMSSVSKDPVERIRQAALVVYSRLGKKEAHPILVDALTDISPQVRQAAVEMVVQIGKSVMPTIHPMLGLTDSSLRATIVLILSRIDQHEYGSLISTHIGHNLSTIYRNYGYLTALSPYKKYTSITVLQNTLQEQNQHFLDEIFYLLSALHNPDAIKVITKSLGSENVLMRANAVEALESLTTPQTARLIGPLYDPNVEPKYLLHLSEDTWEMEHPDSAQIIELFTETDDDWLKAITIFALAEISETTTKPPAQTSLRSSPSANLWEALEDTGVKKTKKRRKQVANIFSLLDDNDSDTEQKEPKPACPRQKRPINPLTILTGGAEKSTSQTATEPESTPYREELPLEFHARIGNIIDDAIKDPDIDVRVAAQSAKRTMTGVQIIDLHLAAHKTNRMATDSTHEAVINQEEFMLSTIEKIIFLKKVPFFEGMTIDQLKTLANVCDEELFEEDARIFGEGEAGGTLYMVISGKVAIEKEGKRKGSFARINTLQAHSYFGEMNLFDNSPYTNSATAIQDTLTLRLRREPLIALARQYPDMSLELINVLSQRLREVSAQVAELTRTKPRELHKLLDQFD